MAMLLPGDVDTSISMVPWHDDITERVVQLDCSGGSPVFTPKSRSSKGHIMADSDVLKHCFGFIYSFFRGGMGGLILGFKDNVTLLIRDKMTVPL